MGPTRKIAELPSGVVTREDSVRIGDQDFHCEVTGTMELPHFVTSARPVELPPALLALSEDAQVSYEYSIGGSRGSGTTSARAYRTELQEIIARQADDYFTVDEAAQVLADSRAGKNGKGWVEEIRAAHRAGALAIRERRSRIAFNPERPAKHASIPNTWTSIQSGEHNYLDLVKGSDVAAWLHASAGYGFPEAPKAESPQAIPEADPQRRLKALRDLGGSAKRFKNKWRFKRIKALVKVEKDKQRKRSDEKTIRADLTVAAEAEFKEGREPTGHNPWPLT